MQILGANSAPVVDVLDALAEDLASVASALRDVDVPGARRVGEAIGGAIYALVYDQVKANGPETLPELVPMATYMTLAPFLGSDEAFALAIGEDR